MLFPFQRFCLFVYKTILWLIPSGVYWAPGTISSVSLFKEGLSIHGSRNQLSKALGKGLQMLTAPKAQRQRCRVGNAPGGPQPPHLAGLGAPRWSSHVLWLWPQVQGTAQWRDPGWTSARLTASQHVTGRHWGLGQVGREWCSLHVSMHKIKRSKCSS